MHPLLYHSALKIKQYFTALVSAEVFQSRCPRMSRALPRNRPDGDTGRPKLSMLLNLASRNFNYTVPLSPTELCTPCTTNARAHSMGKVRCQGAQGGGGG